MKRAERPLVARVDDGVVQRDGHVSLLDRTSAVTRPRRLPARSGHPTEPPDRQAAGQRTISAPSAASSAVISVSFFSTASRVPRPS